MLCPRGAARKSLGLCSHPLVISAEFSGVQVAADLKALLSVMRNPVKGLRLGACRADSLSSGRESAVWEAGEHGKASCLCTRLDRPPPGPYSRDWWPRPCSLSLSIRSSTVAPQVRTDRRGCNSPVHTGKSHLTLGFRCQRVKRKSRLVKTTLSVMAGGTACTTGTGLNCDFAFFVFADHAKLNLRVKCA